MIVCKPDPRDPSRRIFVPLRRHPQLGSWVGIGRGEHLAFASEVEALKCALEHARIFWANVERMTGVLSTHSELVLCTDNELANPYDLAMLGAICDLEVTVKYLGEALQYLFSPPPENECVVIDVARLVIVDDQADESAPRAGRGPATAPGGAP